MMVKKKWTYSLEIKNKKYEKKEKKKYAVGGAGIFDSIGNFFTRMFSSNAAKQLASAALQAGKTAAEDIGMKSIDAIKQLRLMLVRN